MTSLEVIALLLVFLSSIFLGSIMGKLYVKVLKTIAKQFPKVAMVLAIILTVELLIITIFFLGKAFNIW